MKLDKIKTKLNKWLSKNIKNPQNFIMFIVFGIIGIILISNIGAAPTQGIKAASNPKAAMGVGGTPANVYAKWLGRSNPASDIKYGEFNKHFSPGFKDSIINVGASKDNRTAVITIGLSPDDTNFLADQSKDPKICGSYGQSKDASLNEYQLLAAKYEGKTTAISNLGNAKSDNNKNGIKDNIENLYRSSKGCYDNTFEFYADSILSSKAYEHNPDGSPQFIIRIGHEHDGAWSWWSAINQEDANKQKALNYAEGKNGEELFIAAFRNAHNKITNRIKQSQPNAKIYWEYNGTYKLAENNLISRTYPGDQYVDIVGIDFYDRQYTGSCADQKPGEITVPDCRTQQEKEQAWIKTELALDVISDFAASKGKLIGVSEQHVSTTVRTVDGVKKWENGADNAYYVQKVYDWVKKETTQRGRLAYIVFFERVGSFSSKELADTLGAEGLKSIHKLTPGNSNQLQLPFEDQNITCALEWDYYPLDNNGNPVTSQSKVTHKSLFPKAATKFLQLWSGPIDNENTKSSHPNCIKIGVVNGGNEDKNTPPIVSIPSKLNATTNVPVTINASVTDDGKPNNTLSYSWSKISGTGTVNFTNSSQKNTDVSFSTQGTYTLQLSVSDSQLTTIKLVEVTVTNSTTTAERQFVALDETISHNGLQFTKATNLKVPENWETPNNFKDGNTYARLEIESIPLDNDRTLLAQVCFFRDGINQQICSGTVKFGEEGIVYAQLGTPSSATWFKKGGTWDFTRPIESAQIQIKDAETGKNLLTQNCGNTCSTTEIVSQTTPLTLSLQLVVVSKDANIKPLTNWINDQECPVEFGCTETTNPVDLPPFVRIKNASSSVVNETSLSFNIDATDSSGISKVELYRDGILTSTKSTTPYNLTLDTNTITNGNYTFSAVAYDTSGNKSTSQITIVKIRNPNIDRVGVVDINDLTRIISTWGKTNDSTTDLDDSGKVDIGDLSILISKWGQ